MDPSVLKVFKCPFEKIRLGRNNDGGYIIADIPNVKYTILLSGGIGGESSFEEDFVKKYPYTKAYAFDGTDDSLPNQNDKITFIKKNIGYHNDTLNTNLHDYIFKNECIFVKMDIEGSEIDWIKSLSNEQINKFEQIVMEFHYPFSNREIDVFDKINKNHYLIHFHGNNHAGVRIHRGIIIPDVFECTYLHKKYFSNVPQLNRELLPNNIDMKNNPLVPEIYLNYPPFVNYKNNIILNNLYLDEFKMINFEYLVTSTYYNLNSGVQEYRLYSYLSTLFNNIIILDLGTGQGTSAVALSHNINNKVITYDIINYINNDNHSIYKKPNIEFRIKNILDDLNEEFVSKIKIVIIDIDNYGNIQKDIIDKIDKLYKLNFSGMIILDDVFNHPNYVIKDSMNILLKNLDTYKNTKKIDVSKYGHWSGTCILLMNTDIELILD